MPTDNIPLEEGILDDLIGLGFSAVTGERLGTP